MDYDQTYVFGSNLDTTSASEWPKMEYYLKLFFFYQSFSVS